MSKINKTTFLMSRSSTPTALSVQKLIVPTFTKKSQQISGVKVILTANTKAIFFSGKEPYVMMKRWLRPVAFLLIIWVLTSCGSDKQASQSQSGGYKDTKTMVLDILKTEDGKKAIMTALSGGSGGGSGGSSQSEGQMKLLSAGDSQQIQLAVKDVLTDTSNNKFLQSVMTDPKFAGQFAKAIQKDTKQLQKDLMKDPDYQKSLMDAMKNPDFEKMLMDAMKGPQYRQQMKTVMQESLQSPLFRLELMNLMKKALEEESQPQSKGQQQGQGGSGSGGSSGGGGGEQGQGEKKQQ
ncbi:spore germination lipoprotein GerD [Paenibacillus sp. RC67]|uniref:spore germination lipoprotein GerD n=1 Tax=Paenibacillus sp. RC67 TaxID=3039392 RepID=UPI0032C217B8